VLKFILKPKDYYEIKHWAKKIALALSSGLLIEFMGIS
jgi:hypothetical protein